MTTFEDIIAGQGKFVQYNLTDGSHYVRKELADYVHCADGTTLSVQASSTHYCTPRTDSGPYSRVEVGYPTVDPPDTWAEYADGEYPSDVYAYVPVEVVAAYIAAHGGEAA